MKVLQVNNCYKSGSTGKIVADIHAELQKQGVESIVCYGRGKKVRESNVRKTCAEMYSKINNLNTRITGIMYGGCFFSTNRLISIIKKEKPDVVHLHCINGYFVNIYRLIEWLKKNHVKTVLTLHAEFMHTANCGHAFECEKWIAGCGHCPRFREETKSWIFDRTSKSWMKMKMAFDGFNDNLIITSVSPWLMERAKQSPILADKKHCVVLNGLDTEIFKPYDTSKLKAELGIKDEKIVFHATPTFNNDPNHIKGGYYVLKLAEMMKNENVKIVVAGRYDKDLSIPANVILLGQICDQKLLARLYSMADVTVLASKKETFSMVTAESLCCGTPVVGFKAGAPEMIALRECCEFVDYGNIESLKRAVELKICSEYQSEEIAYIASNKYGKHVMLKNYMGKYKI